MQLKTKKSKLGRINKKLKALQAKYPDVNLKDIKMWRAYNEHFDLVKQKIQLAVDVKFCSSESRIEKCSDCICWKLNA